jgi:hypothetical protein
MEHETILKCLLSVCFGPCVVLCHLRDGNRLSHLDPALKEPLAIAPPHEIESHSPVKTAAMVRHRSEC